MLNRNVKIDHIPWEEIKTQRYLFFLFGEDFKVIYSGKRERVMEIEHNLCTLYLLS